MGKPKEKHKGRSRGAAAFDASADDGFVGGPGKGNARQKGKLPQKGRAKGHGPHTYGLDDLERELAAVGLRVKGISADGNCFFRALSDQLHGNEASHGELRSRVMDHVEECRHQYEPFVEDDEPFAKYLARMRKDGTWAGHIELQAASLALKANICVYQAGQPVWTIRNHEEGAPTLHLSYHDGQHYNSVRLAGASGSELPQPLSLGPAAADPVAVSAGQRAWGPQEVARVAAGTGCGSERRVAQALDECRGNVDQATELLIERMAQEEAEGAGAADATAADADSAPLKLPNGVVSSYSGSMGGTAGPSSNPVSGEAQLQPQQQQPQLTGQGSTAASPAPAGGRSNVAAEQVQRGGCESAAAAPPAAAAGSSPVGVLEQMELRVQPSPACPGSVQVQLQVVAGSGTQPAGRCSAADTSGHSSGEEENAGEVGATDGGLSRQRQQEGQQEEQQAGEAGKQGRGRKKGVRLKGKQGAGREGGKPPPRNKPCPCGSKRKYKNCCGAAGQGPAGLAGAALGGGGVEGRAAAAAAAVQLQTLYI